MFFLSILYFLYILRPLFKNQDRCGLDERSVCSLHDVKEDNATIKKIINMQEKKELLDFLKSNHTSHVTKLYVIGDKNTPTIVNIFNGGLLDDWNFDVFM